MLKISIREKGRQTREDTIDGMFLCRYIPGGSVYVDHGDRAAWNVRRIVISKGSDPF